MKRTSFALTKTGRLRVATKWFGRICVWAVIFGVVSCEDSRPDLKEMLAGKEYKYWRVDSNDTGYRKYYYFDTNNNWLIFIQPSHGSFRKDEERCIRRTETYEIISDSIIRYDDRDWHLVEMKDSVIVLKCSSRWDKAIRMDTLCLAKDDEIPPSFRKAQPKEPTIAPQCYADTICSYSSITSQ